MLRRLSSTSDIICLPDSSQTKARPWQRMAVMKDLFIHQLRNMIARIGLLLVPVSVALVISFPMFLASDGSTLSDSIEECGELRSIFYLPEERVRLLVLQELPSDLPNVASLEQETSVGREKWFYVAENNSSFWQAMGLTSEWVLAFMAHGEFISFTHAWEQKHFLPPREDCTNGWSGPVCSLTSLLDMGPDGVLSYINGTVRERLPVTFVFSHPIPEGTRPFYTHFISHYATVVFAVIVTVLGVGLAAAAQLRGRIKTQIDYAVLWYFVVAWIATSPGGIGYMTWTCMTEKSHSFALYPVLFVVVGYSAVLASNIQLQWILVFKIEVMQSAQISNRKLRRTLYLEHAALFMTILAQLGVLVGFFLENIVVIFLFMGLTNIMLAFVTIADLAFSGYAIAAYMKPLMSVRRSLVEAAAAHDSGSAGSGDSELRNLQKAYRVTLMNVGASVLAVFSTTTSYMMMLLFLVCMMRQDTPWWMYEFGMRVQIFDSILNDICTIIFADLFYLNVATGDGADHRTLWAIGQVGLHAALRHQQHDEQHEQLMQKLNTLAKGRNPNLREQMVNWEIQLRVASLERFRSGETCVAEHLFATMQTLAKEELRRLMELVHTIISLYQQASTRFEYLLAIEHQEIEKQQALPDQLLKECKDWHSIDDNTLAMEYLYGLADVIASKFDQHVSTLVDAFNAAQYPEDLGLDPAEFHFRIFTLPDTCVKQIWGPKKTKERGWQKVKSDYADREFPQAACLLDIERMLLTFPDPYALAVFYAFLVQEGSLHVVRVKNRFLGQAGVTGGAGVTGEAQREEFECKDLLVNVKVEGMIVEMQLALENLAELKSCMHPFYKLGRASSFQDLWTESIFSKPHDKTQPVHSHRMDLKPTVPTKIVTPPLVRAPSLLIPVCADKDGSPQPKTGNGKTSSDMVLPGQAQN